MEEKVINALKVTSPAFDHNHFIPEKFTCEGANVNPPLHISALPELTKTLTLIIDDPDAPDRTWDHWVVWNIPPSEKIEEDSKPGKEGFNDFNQHHYGGPCPPGGVHRYFFKIYALDASLDLSTNARKIQLEKAMKGHILAYGELIGFYHRRKSLWARNFTKSIFWPG